MRLAMSASDSCGKGAIGVPGLPVLMTFFSSPLLVPSQKALAVKSEGFGSSAIAAGPLPSALAP